MEDFILIKKIQSGDTDAFEIIVRKYYQSIYLFCCRRLNGDPDTAADITQDVFLKLLENIQSVRKIGKFQNYLLTIAVNTCNNYAKKAKPLYMDLETLEDIEDTDNAFEKVEPNELKAEVQYAINTLPDYQKEVIILRFYYDLKIREIATITKVSVSTVKSRLQQGIKKLERYLADFRGGDNV
ncbi:MULTISPECIES: RNA polymerase sigma factor [Blautia]|uniref:RNA polymerase sigma factor n=1 Tax=Blautia TaxID=572511 RepID=UPI00156FB67E|nr:sigma-70 family RNA polymerase sigma factor [Blautia wexlerae]NSG03507.1 RNA polymerase sigma factor [Blautia wexlerae]